MNVQSIENEKMKDIKKIAEKKSFKFVKESSNRFKLLLNSNLYNDFIGDLLEEVLNGMDFKTIIKKGDSELTILLLNDFL